ncbi:MAG: hypothetical protein PHG65_02350 [Kiritimatiellae bacterium]|nr:hypothetical protein [Kiritimatiellia bacterium]
MWMKRTWNHPAVVWLVRLVLAGVFLTAAVPKILHPGDFALSVFRYQLAPYGVVNLTAIFLPVIELCSALALLTIPRLRDAALCVMAGMLSLFTAAMLLNIWRGIDISCGCFSQDASAGPMGWLNVARNVTLLGFCLWGLFQEWSGIFACRFRERGIEKSDSNNERVNSTITGERQ